MYNTMYGGMYGFARYFDPTYILVIIGLVISLVASARVKSTFNKYNKVRSARGMTGAQVAAQMLGNAGINDVRIEHIRGNLTDNYDPRQKVLHLSDSVYNSTSVAAIGVAAHECGHAIQHQEEYIPIKVRGAILPVVNFGSMASWPVIIIGIFMGYNQTLINIGIVLFSLVVLFQIVTLPVEFNASRRALAKLDDSGILYGEEVKGARKVLTAAALTYVAAAAASILQLLRLVFLFGNRRD